SCNLPYLSLLSVILFVVAPAQSSPPPPTPTSRDWWVDRRAADSSVPSPAAARPSRHLSTRGRVSLAKRSGFLNLVQPHSPREFPPVCIQPDGRTNREEYPDYEGIPVCARPICKAKRVWRAQQPEPKHKEDEELVDVFHRRSPPFFFL